MSKIKQIGSAMKQEAKVAVVRSSSRKLVKEITKLIVGLLGKKSNKTQQKTIAKSVEKFLSTESGVATVKWAIGALLPMLKNIPMIGQYEKTIELIAKELRVDGMADVGDAVLTKGTEMFATMAPQIFSILKEADDKVRAVDMEEVERLETKPATRNSITKKAANAQKQDEEDETAELKAKVKTGKR